MIGTLWIVAKMIGVIVGLLAIVGAAFYAVAWFLLALVSFVPIIGKRHRHGRWVELNSRSGRK